MTPSGGLGLGLFIFGLLVSRIVAIGGRRRGVWAVQRRDLDVVRGGADGVLCHGVCSYSCGLRNAMGEIYVAGLE